MTQLTLTTYRAIRRAAIFQEANPKSKASSWMLKGHVAEGQPTGSGWIALWRDGAILGYVKAGALRAVGE